MTPLDEGSARQRDLYLTTHNNLKRHTSVCPVEFEPAIPANELPQTHAIQRAATEIDSHLAYKEKNTFVYEHAKVKETNI
jgi:hypothetical protein